MTDIARAAKEPAAEMTCEERKNVLRGVAGALGAVSTALLNEPTAQILADVENVARALGDDRFSGVAATPELLQRFYDRTVVSCTPYFVPLAEGPVTKRVPMDGRVRYGSYQSAVGDHVLRCYKAVGFDWRALPSCPTAKTMVHPDSLGCELAFIAQLALAASAHEGCGVSRAEELLTDFLKRHTAWFASAAECLADSSDDFYARLAAFAVQIVGFLTDLTRPGN